MGALKNSIVFCLMCGVCACGVPGRTVPEPKEIIPPPESFGTVSVVVPVGMVSSYEYTWVASWVGGTAPYTLSWDFGGGAQNIAVAPATSPAPALVMPNTAGGEEYTYTVVVSDAQGFESQAVGTYAVGPLPEQVPVIHDPEEQKDTEEGGEEETDPVPNVKPTIEGVTEELGTITVSVDDSDDALVTVYATEIPGMVFDPSPTLIAVPGTAIFHFAPDENYFVTTGTTTITVNDGNGGVATATVEVFPHIPDEFIFTAGYDRGLKLLTLNRNFSHSEWVHLQFSGPDWIEVSGGAEQVVPGGWSSLELEVGLAEYWDNFDDLNISAYAQLDFENIYPISPIFEATVQIVRPLFIASLDYDYFAEIAHVEIDAAQNAEVATTITFTNGIQGTELQPDTQNPNRYSSQVDFSAANILYGYAQVTVSDQYENSDTGQLWLQHKSVGFVDDRLYAYYDKGQINVGEEVLITVVTGELAHPFRFLLGAGLVLDEDAEYVPNSFNIGSPGGSKEFPDGIWADVILDAFVLGPDALIIPGPNREGTLGDKKRYDFNISPLSLTFPESELDIVGGRGDLFNLKFKYSEPGIKTLTFQQSNGVNRTYYGDYWTGTDRFWDDVSNWHPGLQTSLVVE